MKRKQDDLLFAAADILRNAQSVVAFTGAGISVPSGIPDFRSPGGLWSKYDPWEVASLQALRVNATGVWTFLLEAVDMFGRARPNAAHESLARLESKGFLDGVITQNIDGLHQAAGSANVVEFHGGCENFYCMRCRREYDAQEARSLGKDDIPWMCDCGGVIRPDIVFFGEGIPGPATRRSDEMVRRADAVIIVGTSGEVTPACLIPGRIKSGGGKVIEINIGPTGFGGVTDIRFDAPAEQVLPVLADLVESPA